MKTVHTVQSFLDTFSQNGLQFRIICACKAVKGANHNRHSVVTASWLNSPPPTPHPHLGNVITIISTPGPRRPPNLFPPNEGVLFPPPPLSQPPFPLQPLSRLGGFAIKARPLCRGALSGGTHSPAAFEMHRLCRLCWVDEGGAVASAPGRPSPAGAGNASRTVFRKTAKFGGCSPPHPMYKGGGGGWGFCAKSNSRWEFRGAPWILCGVHSVYRWCARNSRRTRNFAWEMSWSI